VNRVRLAAHVVRVDSSPTDSSCDVRLFALGVYVVPRFDRAGVVGGIRRHVTTCELHEIVVLDGSGSTVASHLDIELPAVVSGNEPVPILVTVTGISGVSKLSFTANATDMTEYPAWRTRRTPLTTAMVMAEVMLDQRR